MFSALRSRLTYTNVAVTVALLFAMTGGAYAAKKYVITSTKQISPSVLKSLQGKAGAAGANGAQGPAGAQGSAGPQGPAGVGGAKGDAGAAGKDGSAGPVGATGAKGETGLKGANGAAGATGPAGVAGPMGPAGPTCPGGECLLPVGATETGVWSFTAKGVAETYVNVSFPLRLVAAPEFHYVTKEEAGTEPAILEGCPGRATKPEAAAGQLCLYEGLTLANASLPEPVGGVDAKSGLDLTFGLVVAENEAFGGGSWAVAR
jgi:hypothetical protein